VILEHMRFVQIFARVYCRVATNRCSAAKLGDYYSHYATSLRYLETCGHLEYALLWKLL